ncbi:MAG: hypothetical protein IJ062_11880 [Firmicutes bacterium]|nr:hypothetical protein [Bacillota bacterium]
MIDIKKIADEADMIINFYAFTVSGDMVRVLNLENTSEAAVLNMNGEMLETTMTDDELAQVLKYFSKNKKYLEENHA